MHLGHRFDGPVERGNVTASDLRKPLSVPAADEVVVQVRLWTLPNRTDIPGQKSVFEGRAHAM
jgi:hypothetical protein